MSNNVINRKLFPPLDPSPDSMKIGFGPKAFFGDLDARNIDMTIFINGRLLKIKNVLG